MTDPTPEEIRAALERRARRRGSRGPKTLPRPNDPTSPERAYAAALRALNRDLVEAAQDFLAKPLARARALAKAEREDARRDAEHGPLDPFVALDFDRLRVRLGRLASRKAEELADLHGDRLAAWHSRELARVLGISLVQEPPEVARTLEAWRRENVALIESIAERLHEDVHETVRDALQRGARVETLASDLGERYGVSESRAELIARDQVLKANGDLTRARHEAAGIERYVWSTSRDERVRDMHEALEGRIFSWDAPPITNERGDRNHPGGDFQCRCVAIPVLD